MSISGLLFKVLESDTGLWVLLYKTCIHFGKCLSLSFHSYCSTYKYAFLFFFQVIFTVLAINGDHINELMKRQMSDKNKSYIYYSEPKDLLKKEDRDMLIESFVRLSNKFGKWHIFYVNIYLYEFWSKCIHRRWHIFYINIHLYEFCSKCIHRHWWYGVNTIFRQADRWKEGFLHIQVPLELD